MRQRELISRLAVDCATLAASGEPYSDLLVTGLSRIVGIDNVALINHIDASRPVGDRITSIATDGRTTTTYVVPYEQDALLDEIGRANHPVIGAMERRDRFTVVRVSDMIEMPKLWASEFYRVNEGTINARYSLAMQLQMRGNRAVCVFLNRTHADFTLSEMDLLELLRRPLAAAITFRTELDGVMAGLEHKPNNRPVLHRSRLDALTPRQRDVLALLAQGWTNAKIGRRIGITERTVRKHVADVYDRLGVGNRAAAAAVWERLRVFEA